MQKRTIAVLGVLMLLMSSCSIFKGDNCDCPKFSHQDTIQAPTYMFADQNTTYGSISHPSANEGSLASH